LILLNISIWSGLSVQAVENLISGCPGFSVSGLSGEIESVASTRAFLFQLCSAGLSIHQ
jgi:hypothetical protein